MLPTDITAHRRYDGSATWTFGADFDITNIDFFAKARNSASDAEILEFTTSKDGQSLTLSWTESDLSAIDNGAYYYDLKGVDAAGNDIFFWEGTFYKKYGATDVP